MLSKGWKQASKKPIGQGASVTEVSFGHKSKKKEFSSKAPVNANRVFNKGNSRQQGVRKARERAKGKQKKSAWSQVPQKS